MLPEQKIVIPAQKVCCEECAGGASSSFFVVANDFALEDVTFLREFRDSVVAAI